MSFIRIYVTLLKMLKFKRTVSGEPTTFTELHRRLVSALTETVPYTYFIPHSISGMAHYESNLGYDVTLSYRVALFHRVILSYSVTLSLT
jgi:hypothetical protein